METNVINPAEERNVSALPPATGSSKINVGTAERILSVVMGTGLSVWAVRNMRKPSGKIVGILGALLLKRGVTGFCEVNSLLNRNTANKKAMAMEVKGTYTINKPRAEVYAFWRNLENLPTFMKHLKSVEVLDERRSSWTAKLPGGVGTVSWEAVLEEEGQNSFLSWSSLPGSTIDNAGEVQFVDAPRNQGTEIRAKISYRLPAGDVGSIAGQLINPVVEKMIKDDLRRFKSLLETGEIPVSGSSSSEGKKSKEPLVKK